MKIFKIIFALSFLATPLYPASTSRSKALEQHIKEAKAYETRELWHKAIEALEKAINLSPKDWKIWMDLGSIYVKVTLNDMAIAAYEKTLSLNDKAKNEVLLPLGKLYRQRGTLDQAQTSLEQYTLIHPESEEALNELAQTYEEQGKYADAIRIQQRTVNLNESAYNLARLGDLQAANGETEPAKNSYIAATKNLAPGSQYKGISDANLMYGLAAWQNGQATAAETALSAYIVKQPNAPLALFFRALARMETGKLALAKEDAKSALAQAPTESQLKEYCEILWQTINK